MHRLGTRSHIRWALAAAPAVVLALGCATTGQRSERGFDLPHAFDAGWRGKKVCEVLHEGDEVRVGICTFQPGVGHERHYHRPHFGYALEGGTMRITDDDGVREVEIPVGTNWSSDEVTVHEAFNAGGTTTRYLIVEPN